MIASFDVILRGKSWRRRRRRRLQNSRFRKAGSAVSVILECEARERLAPLSLAIFALTPDLSFEYGPSLAFPRKYDCFAVYEILNCIWSNSYYSLQPLAERLPELASKLETLHYWFFTEHRRGYQSKRLTDHWAGER